MASRVAFTVLHMTTTQRLARAFLVILIVFSVGLVDDGDTSDEDRDPHPVELVVVRGSNV